MYNLIVLGLRAFYIASSIAILIVRLVPELRARFLSYGARDDRHRGKSHEGIRPGGGGQILDFFATFQVPHAWFIHFYAVSVASSIACLYLFRDGGYLAAHGEHFASRLPPRVCAVLMLIQGSRRFLECLLVTKASASSHMWLGHYAIGLAFYVATNIAIWIEHLREQDTPSHASGVTETIDVLRYFRWSALFCYTSYRQYTYHRYLSSLKKYTLPDWSSFKSVAAPHYTAECAIYLALALLDAPQGKTVNGTLLCAFVFVVVNLGVTADGTKSWMMQKFPERTQEIQRRWKMIPYVW